MKYDMASRLLDGGIEGNYYVVEDDENEYIFKYENGELVKKDEKPSLFDIYFKEDYDEIGDAVSVYSDVSIETVDYINDNIFGTPSNFEAIGDFINTLNDKQVLAINAENQKYHFVYNLDDNKVAIVLNDATTAAKYPETNAIDVTLGNKTKILRAININTAEELVAFSNVTNKHLTNNFAPTDDNIYMKNSPIVVANLKNSVDLFNIEWTPISNWYWFTNGGGGLSTPNVHQIKLIFNGNCNAIYNITNSFVGSIDGNSIIKDVTLKYSIGSSIERQNMSNINSKDTKNNKNDGDQPYHFGLLACSTLVSPTQPVINEEDTIIIDNIRIGGEVYLYNDDQSANEIGIIFGGAAVKYNGHPYNQDNKYQISFNNCYLFMDDGDYFDFSAITGDSFALLVANPDTKDFYITEGKIYRKDENIKFSKGEINTYYGIFDNGILPYLGVVG